MRDTALLYKVKSLGALLLLRLLVQVLGQGADLELTGRFAVNV